MHQDIIRTILALQNKKPGDDPADKELTAKQKLLVDLVRAGLQKTSMPKRTTSSSPSRREINLLLQNMLSGDFSKKQARTFLSHLFFNDKFYNTLGPLLEIAVLNEEKETPPINMLSDDELIKIVLSQAKGAAKRRSLPHTLQQLVERFIRKRHYRKFVPVLAATALLAIVTLALINRPNAVYLSYFNEPNAPTLENVPVALRSSSDPMHSDHIGALRSQLRSGLASYLAKDYQAALDQLQKLEQAAQGEDTGSEFLLWKQEYYFYYGMSHLGLSRGRPFNRTQAAKAAQLLQASLAAGESLSNVPDEMRFFLGMALMLKGDKRNAVIQLSQISGSSDFYESAIKLIAY